ncbi:hypothetical protein [Desulfobacter sp.]
MSEITGDMLVSKLLNWGMAVEIILPKFGDAAEKQSVKVLLK